MQYFDTGSSFQFVLSSLLFMFSIPAPFFGILIQGAPLGMLRLPLWCGGLAGAFRLFLRVLGAKWVWMVVWVVAGGGLETNF